MSPVIKAALEKVWIAAKAFTWAIVGGGTGALVDSYQQWSTYDDPLDYKAIKNHFITGAVIGLVGWWRKEVARATPVPTSSATITVETSTPIPNMELEGTTKSA